MYDASESGIRFNYAALDKTQQDAISYVERIFDSARSMGGWTDSDSRAIVDVWRGLHYLMLPPEKTEVRLSKTKYPNLPSGYVSSESIPSYQPEESSDE